MDEYGEYLFKIPHKMTNEWIDYAENVHIRTPFKYPSNNNSLITNNNSFLTNGSMHHQPPQQLYNKMGIKPFNNNLNNNNSNTLNQYNLTNKFQKPRGKLNTSSIQGLIGEKKMLFDQNIISLSVKNRKKNARQKRKYNFFFISIVLLFVGCVS